MVGEFPELQGLMGGYYAAAQGEHPAVAKAIRDHYKPVGQGDEVPTAPVTVAVSLADKLDTIGRFFAIEEYPTGSKDPFALRRAALGIISLVVANGLRLSYAQATFRGIVIHDTGDPEDIGRSPTFRPLMTLENFFADRLKIQQREAGVRHDLIDAVFALGGEDDLVRLLARVRALQAFVGTEDGANLLAGYKRAANILKKEGYPPSVRVERSRDTDQRDDAESFSTTLEANGISGLPYTPEPEETALRTALDSAEPRAAAAVEAEAFEGAMAALATLRAPIDAFFDKVTVNDPDPARREARLNLLARVRDAVHRVADFSRIEG